MWDCLGNICRGRCCFASGISIIMIRKKEGEPPNPSLSLLCQVSHKERVGGHITFVLISVVFVSPLRLFPTSVEGRIRFRTGTFVEVCILYTRVGPWLAPVPGTACLACCSLSASSSKVFCFGTAEATLYCVTGKSEKLRAQLLFVGKKGAAGCGGLVQNKERHRL